MGGAERGQHNNAEQSQRVCNDGFHWPGQFGASLHLCVNSCFGRNVHLARVGPRVLRAQRLFG